MAETCFQRWLKSNEKTMLPTTQDFLNKNKEKIKSIENKIMEAIYLKKSRDYVLYDIIDYPVIKRLATKRNVPEEDFKFLLRLVGPYKTQKTYYGSMVAKYFNHVLDGIKLEEDNPWFFSNLKLEKCALKHIPDEIICNTITEEGLFKYTKGFISNVLKKYKIAETFLYDVKDFFMGYLPSPDYFSYVIDRIPSYVHFTTKYEFLKMAKSDIIAVYKMLVCGKKTNNPPQSKEEFASFINLDARKNISFDKIAEEANRIRTKILGSLKSNEIKEEIKKIFEKYKSPTKAYEQIRKYVEAQAHSLSPNLIKNLEIGSEEYKKVKDKIHDLKMLTVGMRSVRIDVVEKKAKEFSKKIRKEFKKVGAKNIINICIAIVCYLILFKLAYREGFKGTIFSIVKLLIFLKKNWKKFNSTQKIVILFASSGLMITVGITVYDFVKLMIKVAK